MDKKTTRGIGMSRGVNKVILIGNVGSDVVCKYMPNGTAVANFSVATSEEWKDKNSGEKQEKVEWHRIAIFGKLAEIVEKYVKKGSKLYLEGRLQTREWEQDGVKRYSTEVVCNELQMLDSKPQGGQGQPAQQQSQPQAAPSNFDNFDDDIPF